MTIQAHIPVLREQVLAVLAPRSGETFLDCTAGLGGHAAAVARALAGHHEGSAGTIILNDSDPKNLALAEGNVGNAASEETESGVALRVTRGNFAELPHTLAAWGVRANMVLADLGFASTQVDDPARGFSFSKGDGPLDMRMDPMAPVTAADLVNSLPEAELASLISDFGEDRNARRIARKLVQSRAGNPILTTARLADLVRSASPGSRGPGGIDPATRTFQALRMAVNDEVGSLEALLGAMVREAELLANTGTGTWLAPGARVAVIAFHSLEDRPVKHAMDRMIKLGATDLTHGPQIATEAEVAINPRARSAKLRAVRLPG